MSCRSLLLLLIAAMAACAEVSVRETQPSVDASQTPVVTVFLLRRGWHTDLVLEMADLLPPLDSIGGDFPDARYLGIGFADRHYVLATHRNLLDLILAPIPGRGLILGMGTVHDPVELYGAAHVLELTLSREQSAALQQFIWRSMKQDAAGRASPFLWGKIPGNLYFDSAWWYDGAYTCNTWTAEALGAAGLAVSHTGVLFAGQVWDQVSALPQTRTIVSVQASQHAAHADSFDANR